MTAANKKGVHRIAWNLRHATQVAITDEKSGANPDRPSGAYAVPGTYSATLNSRVNGMTSEIAGPVSFDLVRITEQALPGSTPAEATAFQRQVADAQTAVSAANTTVADLTAKLKLYRMAIDRASGGATLEGQYNMIRAEVQALDEALTGSNAARRKGTTPATITSRVNYAARSGSTTYDPTTYGPTTQSHQQLGWAMEAFVDVRGRLSVLTGATVPAFENAMESAGAPWVKGADLR